MNGEGQKKKDGMAGTEKKSDIERNKEEGRQNDKKKKERDAEQIRCKNHYHNYSNKR